MATINATISINSDVTGYSTPIANSMTMTKAGTLAGLDQATGLVRKTLTSTNEVDLLTVGAGVVADVASDKFSSKLYIKNVNSDSSEFFTVGLGKSSGGGTKQAFAVSADANRSVEIGRLYAGDFMIIPWDAASDENDVFVKPSVATNTVIEYQVFYE
jgi:hypothetical protein|tara:strand:+ start:1366 stop:1839 length:474 start_codon:yes stop_codon:yes gene_type:complete